MHLSCFICLGGSFINLLLAFFWWDKVVEKQSFSSASKGEEEGVFDRFGGSSEGVGNQEC